jgi:hypothetical protein
LPGGASGTLVVCQRLEHELTREKAPTMWFFFLPLLSFFQVADTAVTGQPPRTLEDMFERASRETDIDRASSLLASFLTDDSRIRSAFSTTRALNERTVYLLYGVRWRFAGRKIPHEESDRDWRRRVRILVETVSTKPVLIRLVMRADRYEASIRRHVSYPSHSWFPFFGETYADDLVEYYVEDLRRDSAHPAQPIHAEFDPSRIVVTAEDVEVSLLWQWQMLCGVCDRLDLIDKSTVKNWRTRFPELDVWFQKNRPFILWDKKGSCIRVDQEAKEFGSPTERKLRKIPELKPPWPSPMAEPE